MYSLSTFCCVCLHDGEELQSLNDKDFDNVQLISKLKFCALQSDECVLDDAAIFICIQCCHILRLAYNFKKMCIKNNKFIKGYISQLRCNSNKDISLRKLKDYVDNIPLSQYITIKENDESRIKSPTIIENQSRIKKEDESQEVQSEPELLENFEPEINIHEINIDPIRKIKKNKTKIINNESHPLTQNNDFQEKSSTQTLHLLKKLVNGTQSAAVDKLRELITKPIPDESIDEFQFQEKENEQTTTTNDFETVYVKPEPSEEFEPEDHNIVLLLPGSEEIQNLLNRDDNYCPICRKTFLCKSYYERHITMHTGIKNYECDICHKRFTRKSTLKTHILVHTGEASFTCPLCGKIFTQKGNMKSHMQTHFAIKSYQCFECGRSFTLKQNLKVHLASHDKAKRQECPICKKQVTKTYFASHLNMHQEFRAIT